MRKVIDQTYFEHIAHVQDLIELVLIRSSISTFEETFVKNVALQLGITHAEYQALFSGKLSRIPTRYSSSEKILTMFHRLILLLQVDGHISAPRLHFCRNYALKTGLNLFAVEEILTQVAHHPYRFIPIKDFIYTFKKYLN